MQNIRSKNTLPERALASALKKRRLTFQKYVSKLPGKPDIVFRRKKIAVFVDSDFWHGHSTRFTMPKTNRKYWKLKIEGNKQRDKKVNSKLKKGGWKVIRIWENDIKRSLDRSVRRVLRAIEC